VSIVATSSLVGLGSLSVSSISRLLSFELRLPEFENSGSCAGTLLIISIVILFSLNVSTLSTRCREYYLSSVLEAKSNIHNTTNRWVYHISSFPLLPHHISRHTNVTEREGSCQNCFQFLPFLGLTLCPIQHTIHFLTCAYTYFTALCTTNSLNPKDQHQHYISSPPSQRLSRPSLLDGSSHCSRRSFIMDMPQHHSLFRIRVQNSRSSGRSHHGHCVWPRWLGD